MTILALTHANETMIRNPTSLPDENEIKIEENDYSESQSGISEPESVVVNNELENEDTLEKTLNNAVCC